jgi:hypothetical protein
VVKKPMEKFLTKTGIIHDDLDKREIDRRKKFATHLLGGLIGIAIMLILMKVFLIDGTWSLGAGAVGKGTIDFADYVEGV